MTSSEKKPGDMANSERDTTGKHAEKSSGSSFKI